MAAQLFTTWFTGYFKPTVETYHQKKDSFQHITAVDNAPGHPGALVEMDDEVHVDFIL